MFDRESSPDLFLQIDHREPKAIISMILEIMKEDAKEVIHK